MKSNKTIADIILLFLLFLLFSKIFFLPWIIGDGLHYYAYVRSIVIDHNLDFTNEYAYLGTLGRGEVISPDEKTVTGKPPNPYAIGTAILWLPFFLIAHVIELRMGLNADGYSQLYFTLTTFGTLFFSFLGLVLMYLFIRKFVDSKTALLSTITIWLSSSFFYYVFHDPSMAHAFSMFTVTLFVYYWHKTFGTRSLLKNIFLGVFAGLMTLVYWQNITYSILVLYPLINVLKEGDRQAIKRELTNKFFFCLALFICVIPQFVAWKVIYGQYVTIPQEGGILASTPKYLINLLFSPTHGLFVWTPITLFSFIGLYLFLRVKRKIALYLLLAFCIQLYVNGSIATWHGDWSYGARRLVNSTIIFGLGLAYWLDHLKNKTSFKTTHLFCGIFILWNLLLITQAHYHHSIIAPNHPFSKILVNQIKEAPRLLVKLLSSKIPYNL